MRDVLPTLLDWHHHGHRFATAIVIHTWGSSPRPVGAMMGIREDGVVVGSVSGGCVESAVIQAALEALSSGLPQVLDFGALTDEQVWEVGLSCGGRIRVWVDPQPTTRRGWGVLPSSTVVMATHLDTGERWSWPGDDLPESQRPEATEALSARTSGEGDGWFYHVVSPPDRLLVIGAVHIAVSLVRFAKSLDFEVVVVDPRSALASAERFPDAPDKMAVAWPDDALPSLGLDDSTYAVVLTHDPKIDDVALVHLLRSPVAYIGALGSRATQAKRRAFLLEQGFSEGEIDRIHGPVGLNIGARTPEEIAVSILAEIIQVRRGTRA
ncbi:MAG: XdhC family protein [Methanoregulaceae archaeon]|nr:XdhC family protein [Methanoregulaceae archaeon]